MKKFLVILLISIILCENIEEPISNKKEIEEFQSKFFGKLIKLLESTYLIILKKIYTKRAGILVLQVFNFAKKIINFRNNLFPKKSLLARIFSSEKNNFGKKYFEIIRNAKSYPKVKQILEKYNPFFLNYKREFFNSLKEKKPTKIPYEIKENDEIIKLIKEYEEMSIMYENFLRKEEEKYVKMEKELYKQKNETKKIIY